jgi:tetratricopeptide (TPR) repeat protein
MTLDQYSLCPCGNGKKIKFCKCNEHFQEMQTIHRMTEGEQNVAALDRINANLKTMPSEPWLLAMKCELLLQLREFESLEETSAKFIRLQPDNPLAKLNRALVAVIRGNTEEGANLLLQSISEAQESLPPMTATVAINLIEVMAQRAMILPALLHAELMFEMGDVMARVAHSAVESLVGHPQAGTLSKETAPSPLSGEGTPYAERLAEAEALVANFRISAAKTKLESMQREFGQQPPILQNLLYCQLLLTDLESAALTCRKLAGSTSLDESQRIYYQAMVYELAPKSGGVTQTEDLSIYTIEDPEFEAALASNKHLSPIPVEQARGLLEAFLDEEVPPKSAFATLQPILQEQFAQVEAQRPGSWMAFYGKQTDKPARLVVLEPGFGYRKTLMDQVKRELGLTSLKRELVEQLHVAPLAMGNSQILLKHEVPVERREALRDAIRQLMIDEILDTPFDCLGNQTPRQCAGMAEHRLPLQALLLSWQSHNPNTMDDADFQHIHQNLQVSRPSLSAESDVFDRVGGAAYYWTDLSTIDPRSLIQLMQSVLAHSVTTMYRTLVAKSETMSWPSDFQTSAEYTVLNLKTRTVSDPVEAEKLLARIIEAGKKLNVSVGNAILERFEILNMLDRRTEARQFLESSLRENPNDPVLLQFLQAAMMQQQQMAARARSAMPMGTGMPGAEIPGPGGVAAAGGTTASGLWTPDGPSQPSPSDPASSGGSKLWIPGQD